MQKFETVFNVLGL